MEIAMPLRYSLRLALILFAVAQVLGAAVDCGTPLTRQQQVVCATPELLHLDQQLWTVYQRALAAIPVDGRRQFDHDQASWEVNSGGCGDRVDCIRKRYADRIAALQGDWLPGSQMMRAETTEAARRQTEAETQGGTTPADIPIYVAEPKPTSPPVESAPVSTAPQVAEKRNETAPPVPTRNDDWRWLLILGVVAAVVAALVYFVPTIVAFSRKHRNRWLILVLNLAFGATLVGWVIALVWAMNKVDAPMKGGVKYDFQPHDPIL